MNKSIFIVNLKQLINQMKHNMDNIRNRRDWISVTNKWARREKENKNHIFIAKTDKYVSRKELFLNIWGINIKQYFILFNVYSYKSYLLFISYNLVPSKEIKIISNKLF